MSSPTPSVSVIVAAYNDPERLPRSVASIQAQTWTDWELLIANDGSSDRTLAVAEQLAADDERIRVLDLPHGGAARARNAAADVARGEWLAIQDADDYSVPTRLERQVEVLRHEPRVGVLASHINRVSHDGRSLGTVEMGPTSVQDFRRYRGMRPVYVINGTVMMHRQTFLTAGGYPEDYRVGEDLALYSLRMAPRCDILTLPEPLVSVEMHPDSLSRRYAAEIVEADDVVRLNLARLNAGLPELGYQESVEGLTRRGFVASAVRTRRRWRHALFSQGAARVATRSASGVPPLLLAMAIAPVWTMQRLLPRVRSFTR